MSPDLVVWLVFVVASVGAGVAIGWILASHPRVDAPTWPEWIGDTEPEPEPEPPSRDRHVVVVLGTPGHRRMVCPSCVAARRDAQYDQICARCEPLLISKEARP